MSFFAVIAGVGGGLGRACAIRFSREYPVVLLARKPESYESTVSEIKQVGGHAIGIPADAADPESMASAFEAIKRELPDSKLAAAIYNVASPLGKMPFLELTLNDLNASLDGNIRGFFNFAHHSIPLLLDAVGTSTRPPTLIVTGASASVRGSANFAAFSAGKFALRSLTQSIAREFSPKGVHVAHAIIDGVIEGPRTKGYAPNGGVDDGKMNPDAIAESYWSLHSQHRSTFTQELDLRPYVEKF